MPKDIRNNFLSDKDAARLYVAHPEMKRSPDDWCPTCLGRKTYRWKNEDHDCDCALQLQLIKHYDFAGIGDHYARLSMDDFKSDPAGREWVEKYLHFHEQMVHKGLGLLFHGDYGTGKTFLVMMLMKELVKLGYSCFATTFTGLVEAYTAGWNSAEDKKYFHERMKGSQILFIDDLGKEFKTKNNLAESTLDDVIRSRIQAARPTHVTTNMAPEEMRKGYGGAVFSLLHEVSIAHEVKGDDQRPNVIQRHLDEVIRDETRPVL